MRTDYVSDCISMFVGSKWFGIVLSLLAYAKQTLRNESVIIEKPSDELHVNIKKNYKNSARSKP